MQQFCVRFSRIYVRILCLVRCIYKYIFTPWLSVFHIEKTVNQAYTKSYCFFLISRVVCKMFTYVVPFRMRRSSIANARRNCFHNGNEFSGCDAANKVEIFLFAYYVFAVPFLPFRDRVQFKCQCISALEAESSISPGFFFFVRNEETQTEEAFIRSLRANRSSSLQIVYLHLRG